MSELSEMLDQWTPEIIKQVENVVIISVPDNIMDCATVLDIPKIVIRLLQLGYDPIDMHLPGGCILAKIFPFYEVK
uniref:Uncharacterized protein n=1 Tax=viral metagenome TaxID=1070528 RepID=A0A6M3LZ89_9ZZZZ